MAVDREAEELQEGDHRGEAAAVGAVGREEVLGVLAEEAVGPEAAARVAAAAGQEAVL